MEQMKVFVLLSILVAIALAQNSAVDVIQDCTYSDDSGDYDLTGMIVNLTTTTTKAQMYTGTDPAGYLYYSNVCNVVSSDTGCPTSEQTSTCQLSSTGTQASSCGVVSSQQFQSISTPPLSSVCNLFRLS